MSNLTKTPYDQWHFYLEENAKVRAGESLVYDERQLTDAERWLIAPSLAQFQLGEQSEGHHLIGKISAYAHAINEPAVARIGELLVEDQRRHARLLASFMDHHGLPKLEKHWVDTSFRTIRRFGGLDLMLTTLLIALTIASQYYRSLGPVTRSPMLKRIAAILREEEAAQIHLLNQLIEDVRGRRTPFGYWWRRQASQILFTGALAIVWLNHSRIYRRSGIGFSAYWRVNWRQWRQSGAPPEASANPHLAALLGRNNTDAVVGAEDRQV